MDGFPGSISLIQFVLGALAKGGIVSTPLRRYAPVVTSELRDLYPDVEQSAGTFDFELTDQS